MHFKKNQRILNGMLMKEIKDLNATIRRHGEAHMAQDLLPQFRGLVTKVEKLEGQLNFKLNDGPIHNHTVRITKLEARSADHDESIEALSETVDQSTLSAKMFLDRVADIEILKVQLQGAIRDVETLQLRFDNLNLHQNGLIEEVLNQAKFLAKVQAILDREKDARIMKSAGYKAEIEAQKKEHMVMDKHLDTMVKKGRPRKP